MGGKWLAKEEDVGSGGCSGEEEQEMASSRGGDPNPESGNSNPSEKQDRLGEEPTRVDVRMVFMILAEFCAPMENDMDVVLGVECAVFEKPENPGTHMKPLFIWGHLDGTPV
jgi:hypothetical protein